VFGKKRKREELEAATSAAQRLLTSDDVDAIVRTLNALREMWSDAGYPAAEALEVMRALDERITVLKRRPYEQALRPCGHCSGRSFRISDERTIEQVGVVRLVVCDACCSTLMFWVNRRELTAPMFGEPVLVPDAGGPFR
jgi:hypothetical protein